MSRYNVKNLQDCINQYNRSPLNRAFPSEPMERLQRFLDYIHKNQQQFESENLYDKVISILINNGMVYLDRPCSVKKEQENVFITLYARCTKPTQKALRSLWNCVQQRQFNDITYQRCDNGYGGFARNIEPTGPAIETPRPSNQCCRFFNNACAIATAGIVATTAAAACILSSL